MQITLPPLPKLTISFYFFCMKSVYHLSFNILLFNRQYIMVTVAVTECSIILNHLLEYRFTPNLPLHYTYYTCVCSLSRIADYPKTNTYPFPNMAAFSYYQHEHKPCFAISSYEIAFLSFAFTFI